MDNLTKIILIVLVAFMLLNYSCSRENFGTFNVTKIYDAKEYEEIYNIDRYCEVNGCTQCLTKNNRCGNRKFHCIDNIKVDCGKARFGKKTQIVSDCEVNGCRQCLTKNNLCGNSKFHCIDNIKKDCGKARFGKKTRIVTKICL